MADKKRVLVVGLDGATFEIIDPMVRKGKLPNFAKLMKRASFGPLISSIPPITPCAWTSFATGKAPSKHGLFDFRQHTGDPNKKEQVNRTFVKAKSLWRMLGEHGKRSIVVDVPLTYPPEEINGIMISRVMAPPDKVCTYPGALYEILRKKDYIKKSREKVEDVHGARDANKGQIERPNRQRVILTKERIRQLHKKRRETAFRNITADVDKNIRLAKWLMDEEEWDFFMIVFMSTDHAGHSFWVDKRKVRKVYERIDRAVGELFDHAGEDTVKLIMSDHGFTDVPYDYNINEWLCERGFLSKTLDFPAKDGIDDLKKLMKELKRKRRARRSILNKTRSNVRYIIKTDYSRSKAYMQSGTSYGVRINLEGRDTTGIVKQSEYEAFRDHLIGEFKRIRHPVTGKRIFQYVLKKDDVYPESPFGTVPSPDIFLFSYDMKVFASGQFTRVARLLKKNPKGYGFHHTHGIFFATGRGILNRKVKSANIIDLTPTVLHILGVPIPEDLDGRILKEIFMDDSEYSKKQVSYQAPSIIEARKKAYSKEEEEKIKNRLEALGYIE